MEYKNILVPYDGSEHAIRALEAAKKLVMGSDSTVTVLNVVTHERRTYHFRKRSRVGIDTYLHRLSGLRSALR